MTAASRLRELVQAATPGPWANYMNATVLRKDDFTALRLAVFDSYEDPPGPLTEGQANARLAALAPELAAWAADAAEELWDEVARHQRDAFDAGGGPCVCKDCKYREALLARLDGLLPEDGE